MKKRHSNKNILSSKYRKGIDSDEKFSNQNYLNYKRKTFNRKSNSLKVFNRRESKRSTSKAKHVISEKSPNTDFKKKFEMEKKSKNRSINKIISGGHSKNLRVRSKDDKSKKEKSKYSHFVVVVYNPNLRYNLQKFRILICRYWQPYK